MNMNPPSSTRKLSASQVWELGCAPSKGGYHGLEQGELAIHLLRQDAKAHQQTQDIVVT